MNNFFTSLLLAFVTAAIICMVLIPLIIQLSIKFSLVDKPNERSSHKNPVPRLGGLTKTVNLSVMPKCVE